MSICVYSFAYFVVWFVIYLDRRLVGCFLFVSYFGSLSGFLFLCLVSCVWLVVFCLFCILLVWLVNCMFGWSAFVLYLVCLVGWLAFVCFVFCLSVFVWLVNCMFAWLAFVCFVFS